MLNGRGIIELAVWDRGLQRQDCKTLNTPGSHALSKNAIMLSY